MGATVSKQKKSSFKEPKQERSRQRVEKIISAARDLVIQHGVNNLKMNDISILANVPAGSLYQYFPTKVSVVAKLFERTLVRYRAMVEGYFEDVETPEDYARAVEQMIWGVHETLIRDPIAKQVIGQMMAEPEIARIYMDDHDYYTDVYLRSLRKIGTDIPEDRVYWRCRVVNEMWDGVIRLSSTLPAEEAKFVLREAIGVGLRELGIPNEY